MLVAPRLTLSWQNFPADLDSGCVLMLGFCHPLDYGFFEKQQQEEVQDYGSTRHCSSQARRPGMLRGIVADPKIHRVGDRGPTTLPPPLQAQKMVFSSARKDVVYAQRANSLAGACAKKKKALLLYVGMNRGPDAVDKFRGGFILDPEPGVVEKLQAEKCECSEIGAVTCALFGLFAAPPFHSSAVLMVSLIGAGPKRDPN